MATFDDLEVDEACEKILDHLARRFSPSTIDVTSETALGRVCAEDVFATAPSPLEPRSIMDGYALHMNGDIEVGGKIEVVGESAAGRPFEGALTAGQAVRISTGAVVPASASVVVAQENTSREASNLLVDNARDLRDGGFIRAAGSDWAGQSLRLSRGMTLGPAEVAMLLALDRPTVSVVTRPSVAIICTGDELLGPSDPYRAGAVRCSNGPMLAHQASAAGGEVIMNTMLGDDPAHLVDALQQAECADLILTSGGVSVGDHDHVHAALEERGAEVIFRRVRMRPGRPVTVAATARSLVCALPGNPASSWVTFELLARPALRSMAGVSRERSQLLQVNLPLAEEVAPLKTRVLFLRAIIREGATHPLPQQASGNLASITGVDCLIRVPAGEALIPRGTHLLTYLVES